MSCLAQVEIGDRQAPYFVPTRPASPSSIAIHLSAVSQRCPNMKPFFVLLSVVLPLAWALPTTGVEKLGPRANTIYSQRHSTQTPSVSAAEAQPITVNSFLAMVVKIFPVNVLVEEVSGAITTGEIAIAAAAGIDTSENDLASGNCGDVIIIFSRGTTESGNVGALAGPQFFDAVQKAVGGMTVAVQGVEYPADVPGFLEGGDKKGSQEM